MVELLASQGKYCTGCGACYNVCPKDAIWMEKNPQGFLYPVIDQSLCIHCKKCEQVCPKLGTDVSNAPEPACYAARAQDDVRAISSSGGIFTLLARWVLAQGGIVCGAAMEADYHVHHICVSDEAGLERLRKSKYVQSDTEHVYREIAQYLKQGRTVLFTGCPCQVAAARKYFAKAQNIYYVDILCHGTPSQQMWQDYIHENFDLNKVKSIDFRNKKNGWRSDQLYVRWNDGSSSTIPWPESAYEEGFQRNISLRDGCEDCEFGGHQRQGDLTIGDFWRVEQYDPQLNDRKGTSVILVNNGTGQKMLEAITPELLDLTPTPIQAARFNRLNTKVSAHPQKERFKTLYPGHSFSTAVFQCRHALYDIGLISNYTIGNYGGGLTQYALYCTLTQMGYSVLMIERALDAPEKPHTRLWIFAQMPYPSYAIAPRFNTIAEMKFLNLQCKTFVTGSDQMFNNNLYNAYGKIMAQNFVQNDHWKVAYAASFGHDHIWGQESDRAEESYFMQKFDRFSVREDTAVDLCRKEFGVQATWVLDPVFLCPKQKYLELISRCTQDPPTEPYLFSYMLDANAEKESILRSIAKKENLQIRAVSDLFHDKEFVLSQWNIETLFDMKVESWLSHIYHCDYFVTDSFHGMCFAIIFHKQFFVLVNKLRGETRFTSLLGLLGLKDRLCYCEAELREKAETLSPIDYDMVEAKLKQERHRSLAWLRDAIEDGNGVKKPFTTFDILDTRCDDLCRRFDQRCDSLSNQYHVLENQLNDLRRSPSWRIGRTITWIPRKIRGGYRCVKENGWKYTIRHFGEKVKGKIHH